MERKIEIFNFASRTRMLLVRLLALVRWASSASKVCWFCHHCIACVCHQADGLIKGGQVCQHRDVPWEAVWALPRHSQPACRNGKRNLGDYPTSCYWASHLASCIFPSILKSYLARFELRFLTSTYRQQQRFWQQAVTRDCRAACPRESSLLRRSLPRRGPEHCWGWIRLGRVTT